MNEQLTCKFVLHQRVYIAELETYGIVIGIYYSDTGDQYQIRYFYDGVAKTVYFYPWELRDEK